VVLCVCVCVCGVWSGGAMSVRHHDVVEVEAARCRRAAENQSPLTVLSKTIGAAIYANEKCYTMSHVFFGNRKEIQACKYIYPE
jgi:hypothetical protein